MSDNRLAKAIVWIGDEIDRRGQCVFLDAARKFGLDDRDLRNRYKAKETYRRMIRDRSKGESK